MLRLSLLCVVLGFAFLTAGCGGPKQTPPVQREPEGSPVQLRKDLGVIAESGTGDSALQPIVMGMTALDPNFAKKKELEASYKKLMSAGSPDQRKQLATEMIGIIDSASPAAATP
ncbi:hypothetical protein [Planctomicrobium piriforme]|uniref:HEAT repeat domain-containing protein n=1 Tax=Planctomicrobium piriforme TaxID=1576369 RepID=A0A1I3SWX3_9PLAN|nr:hypothetical protein [Planctomicrobium piriforme]SFJ63265.1 hypothetical protein SAMN05421753_12619 [Planctomicrobium piriforme]